MKLILNTDKRNKNNEIIYLEYIGKVFRPKIFNEYVKKIQLFCSLEDKRVKQKVIVRVYKIDNKKAYCNIEGVR